MHWTTPVLLVIRWNSLDVQFLATITTIARCRNVTCQPHHSCHRVVQQVTKTEFPTPKLRLLYMQTRSVCLSICLSVCLLTYTVCTILNSPKYIAKLVIYLAEPHLFCNHRAQDTSSVESWTILHTTRNKLSNKMSIPSQ